MTSPARTMSFARPSARRGFTLIELLVVMGIMVLLIALALPAFNFMTGSRSTESAQNQLAAALGIARAEAVGLQQPRGVVIFHDAEADRTVAAIVDLRTGPFPEWDNSASKDNPVSYQYGEYRTVTVGTKKTTYVCLEPYTDYDHKTNKPGDSANYWRELTSLNSEYDTSRSDGDSSPILEFRAGTDFLTLAKGVGVQSVGNVAYVPESVSKSHTGSYYRYSTVAAVLFDANGAVKSLPNFDPTSLSGYSGTTPPPQSQYRILPEGLLGTRANLEYLMKRQPVGFLSAGAALTPVTRVRDLSPFVFSRGAYDMTDKKEAKNYSNPYRSNFGLGLVVYDAEAYRNATTAFEGDTDGGQAKMEDWLDQNATPLLVNRFNGTLVKGE